LYLALIDELDRLNRALYQLLVDDDTFSSVFTDLAADLRIREVTREVLTSKEDDSAALSWTKPWRDRLELDLFVVVEISLVAEAVLNLHTKLNLSDLHVLRPNHHWANDLIWCDLSRSYSRTIQGTVDSGFWMDA